VSIVATTTVEFVSADPIAELLTPADSVGAIEQALRNGYDPADDFPAFRPFERTS
jgi:hypothetical protein